MIIQCRAEAVNEFPDPSLLEYEKGICDNLYPPGNNCYEKRENYYF